MRAQEYNDGDSACAVRSVACAVRERDLRNELATMGNGLLALRQL